MNDEQRKAMYRDIMQVFMMLPEEEKSFVSGYIVGTIEARLPERETHKLFELSHPDLRLENAIRWDGNNTDKIDDFLSDRVHSIDVREDILDIYIWEGHICLTQGDYLVKAQDGKICIAERTVQPEGAKYLLRFPA